MLARPTTVTLAKSNTPDDILAALREGRSVVTNRPETSMIYLSVEGAQLGDTIKLNDNSFLVGDCRVTKLLPGHTLKIFNNNEVVYEHKAYFPEKEHNAVFEIRNKGYIRAQIDYDFTPALKKVYTEVEKRFLKGSGDVPTFFWAFTNPIWID